MPTRSPSSAPSPIAIGPASPTSATPSQATPRAISSPVPTPTPSIMPGSEIDPRLVTYGWLMIPGACGGPEAVMNGRPSTSFGAQQRFSVRIQFTELVRALGYESVGPTTVTHRVMGTTFNNPSDNFGFCCAVTSEVPGDYRFQITIRIERTGADVTLKFPYKVVASNAAERDEPRFAPGTTYDSRYVYNAYLVTPDLTRTGADVLTCSRQANAFAASSVFGVIVRFYQQVVSARAISSGPSTVVHFDQNYAGNPQYVMASCCHTTPAMPGSYQLEVSSKLAEGATVVTRIPYTVTGPPTTSPPATSPPATKPPAGVEYVIETAVSDEDLADIRDGVELGATYLRQRVGLDRPRSITVRVRAPTNPGFCCNGGGSPGIGSITISINHPQWKPPRPWDIRTDHKKNVSHEYVHTWQGDLGCLNTPAWILEGMAEFLSYQSIVSAGLLTQSQVDRFLASIVSAEQYATLKELETALPEKANPYNVSNLAWHRLMTTRPVTSIAVFCTDVGAGTQWEAAFAKAFGITTSAFYAEFESYRKTLPQP